MNVKASLFGGTLEGRLCLKLVPGLPWTAEARMDSVPLAALAPFLPQAARNLAGGTVTGDLALDGVCKPDGTALPVLHVRGTLRPDRLRWPAEIAFGGTGEWTLEGTSLVADVRVRLEDSVMVLEGSLAGTGGTVHYLGHEFAVSDLRLNLPAAPSFDPLIDLTARASVLSNAGKLYRLRFDLSGPASRAHPRLASDPPLGQQDIEGLLTLGVPFSVLSETGEGGTRWAQQVFLLRALKVASGRIVGLAEDRAERLLGLDEVHMPAFGGPAEARSDVAIAKRLGGRTTLSYTSPLWNPSDYRVRLDLELNEYLTVESENDQTGDAGIDLRFTKRFR